MAAVAVTMDAQLTSNPRAPVRVRPGDPSISNGFSSARRWGCAAVAAPWQQTACAHAQSRANLAALNLYAGNKPRPFTRPGCFSPRPTRASQPCEARHSRAKRAPRRAGYGTRETPHR